MLSVPTAPLYREHFPRLNNFEILELSNGTHVLMNATTDGQLEKHENLRFHGGPGATLEMRIHSIESVEKNLREAGFSYWTRITDVRPEYGIENISGLSSVWVAEK